MLVAVLMVFSSCSQTTPLNTPTLYINLQQEGEADQRVPAIWCGGVWQGPVATNMYEIFHPLQLYPIHFEGHTIYSYNRNARITLEFDPSFWPDYMEILKWNADYARYTHSYNNEWLQQLQVVEASNGYFYVYNNGVDYIFDITALWTQTLSVAIYTFRLINN